MALNPNIVGAYNEQPQTAETPKVEKPKGVVHYAACGTTGIIAGLGAFYLLRKYTRVGSMETIVLGLAVGAAGAFACNEMSK
jgi:hypothetical protein